MLYHIKISLKVFLCDYKISNNDNDKNTSNDHDDNDHSNNSGDGGVIGSGVGDDNQW